MKAIFVKAFLPCGASTHSTKVAEAYLAGYRNKNPKPMIDEIDFWRTPLPEFDGDRAAAKMSFFGERRSKALVRPYGALPLFTRVVFMPWAWRQHSIPTTIRPTSTRGCFICIKDISTVGFQHILRYLNKQNRGATYTTNGFPIDWL